MASTMRQIAEAIRNKIATINGTPTYTYSLNATGQVFVGESLYAPVSPFVSIQGVGWSSDFEAPLTRYKRQVLFTVYGEVAADGTQQNRALNAMDLLSDVAKALESDPTLGGLAYQLLVTSAGTFDGLEEDGNSFGAFLAEVQVTYQTRTGV